MATYQGLKTVTVQAGSAIAIYRFIVRAADGKYDYAGAQGDADGVSAEAAAADTNTLAMVKMDRGWMKVEAGAAVAALATVSSDATGRAITHVTTAGNYRLGKALDAATAAGEIIRVELHRELDEV
jgi:hypothetical protein